MPGGIDDTITLTRRFPAKALGILLGAVLYFPVALFILLLIKDADDRLIIVAFIFGILAIFLLIAKVRVLWAYMFGPQTLTFTGEYFQFGREYIPYENIAGLGSSDDYRKGTTVFRDGVPVIILYVEIWARSDEWSSLLESKVFPRLIQTTMKRLNSGETIQFGSRLSLDSQALHVGKDKILLPDLSDVRTVSSNKRNQIVITARGRKNPVTVNSVISSPVFFEAIKRFSAMSQS